MTAVELDRVSVSLGGVPVLHEVELDAATGEWLALIGPNGAGKTTALRTMAGLHRYRGRVIIDGQAIDRVSRRRLARTVALVPQEPVLPPAMSVAHYVLLGRTPHLGYLGRESARDRDTVAETLERLDAQHLVHRQLGQLSGGERQRVVIARALVQQPRILLLDEPTTALDIGHQQDVLELIWTLRRDHHLTVLSAMHDLTLAGQFADRVVLVAGGRTVGAGAPGDVLTEQLIATHYGASVDVIENGETRVVAPRRRSGRPASTATTPAEVPVEAPQPPARKRVRSLVVLNTGDGKGKSTAAFGIVMRAVGRDWRVIVIQFIKSGRWKTGEERVCRSLDVEWWSIGDGFTWDSRDLSETEAVAGEAWRSAAAAIGSGDYDLVVLDEVTYPINWGWIDEADVVAAIRNRPARVNVVLTGRDAPPGLLAVADTATEMVKLRHAYDSGVIARRGIDF